jgi:hypothetical protein
MKKRIISLVMTFAMVSALPLSVSAETFSGGDDWSVSFNGSSMQSNFSSTDMDEVIYDMQPGDTAVFQVQLTNEHSKATDWYMSNDIVISMEDSTEASGGAYEYLLTYTDAEGAETVIYSSETVGGEDTTGGEGLHKVSDALGEMFYLSRLESGEAGTIDLEVKLDGETLGNSYQDKLAMLEMQFAVEEAAEDEIVKEKVPGKNITSVDTGDHTDIMLYASLGALAVGILILVLAIRKVRSGRDNTPDNMRKGGR